MNSFGVVNHVEISLIILWFLEIKSPLHKIYLSIQRDTRGRCALTEHAHLVLLVHSNGGSLSRPDIVEDIFLFSSIIHINIYIR